MCWRARSTAQVGRGGRGSVPEWALTIKWRCEAANCLHTCHEVVG